MTIAFCTGISGSEKKAYVNEVVEYAKRRGKKIDVFDVEERMFKIAKDFDMPVVKGKLLDSMPNFRRALRTAAVISILKEIKKTPTIITSHACFFWKDDFEHAFDYSYLRRIKPNIYVTIINTLSTIKENLRRNPSGIGKQFSSEEILYWQNVEKLTTKALADSQKKEFYLISRAQSPRTLYDLLFTSKKKVYLSYPMAFAKQKHFEKIRKFKEKLENFFIVFDPGTASELGSKAFDEKIEDKLRNLTVHRDYQLIDQSNAVIAYFPEIVYAKGTDDEGTYAARTNKEVYVIFPSKNRSPFLSFHATKIFYSEKEFFDFLKKENPAGRI